MCNLLISLLVSFVHIVSDFLTLILLLNKYSVSQKTSPTFLVVALESIAGFS